MILIPAAGDGTRFRAAGYDTPKHELPLGERTMVEAVIASIVSLDTGEETFVATQDWIGKTRGAVDTIVKAFDRILTISKAYENEPLTIANCDQLVKVPENLGLPGNGLIFTFKSASPAHSYVVTDAKDRILSIVEKPELPPSDRAVSGVYYFPSAAPFIEACRWVVNEGSGELYVSAALDKMIEHGYVLYAVDAPTAILGTPEDYQRFQTAQQFAPKCAGGCARCAC